MDAIAIQDANKIRVAMGLAPLPVPGGEGLAFKSNEDGNESEEENDTMSTLEKRTAAASDNWARLEEERKAKEERLRRKENAKKARDAAQRFAALEGKGLGETDEEEVDTRTWLLQQKKRQKKIEKARKYEEEQLERERAAQAEYTAKDLAGVKVGHTMDDIDGGSEQILVLKDTEIGEEDEDDELENLDLREKERLKEKLELLKKKPVYNPNDIDEDEAGGKKSILAHYDEEIEGKKNKGAFTLDGQGSIAKAEVEKREAESNSSKGLRISLDILKDETPVSDYQDPSTIKVRKPKKAKKPKATRQKAVDEDDVLPIEPQAPAPADGDMDVDQPAGQKLKKRAFEFDDDDLLAKLAEQRRQALKKRKKIDVAQLARQIREEDSHTEDSMGDEDGEPGMIIDETTEFIANLRRAADDQDSPRIRSRRRSTSSETEDGHDEGQGDNDGDVGMAESYAAVEDQAFKSLDKSAEPSTESSGAQITATGFEEEEQISSGVGASLAILRKRGLITDSNPGEQNAKDRARAQFLAENRNIIADYDERARRDREAIRESGRWNRMARAEQEAFNRQANEKREQYLAQLQAEHYRKSYNPDVKLEYNDEFGRKMGPKEAFKQMSHQFHGKGSGKQKTEKRLKKIEDERKREAMSSLDSSQHAMNNAVVGQARKNRQAGVRLQ